MNYRADIDGLRAISVLIVLLFHARLLGIQSGFIGVDIFFVISGFLITSNIVRDLGAGKFNLLTFYKRRFLRLAPALIVLLIVLYIIAFYFYLPEDLKMFARSAKHATLYNTNSYFARTTGGYFDAQSDFLLLLHTWSLAIEWQWYALLPIILFILNRLLPQKILSWSIVFLLLFATSYMLYQSAHAEDVTKHYYSLGARISELLVGASITFFPYDKVKLPRFVLSFLGIGALVLIIGSIFRPEVQRMFPNIYALFICLSAAILIVIGQLDGKNFASRLLSLKPLVFIGLISYSLYLWHWPIFSLIRYLNIKETLVISLLSLSLSILLGFLSWKFIEQTTRHFTKKSFLSIIMFLFIVPIISTYALEIYIKKNKGFIDRFSSILSEFRDVKLKYYAIGREKCINNPELEGDPLCISGDKKAFQKKAIVLGDSYANMYWNFIDVQAKNAQVLVESNTYAACLALPDIYLFDWLDNVGSLYQSCHDATKRQYEKIAKGSYDYVILGQVWSYYLKDNIVYKAADDRSTSLSLERFEKALYKSIELIVSSGATPIIFDETYADFINLDNRCYMNSVKWRLKITDDCSSSIVLNEDELKMTKILGALVERYPQIIFVNPKLVQCPNNRCVATIDDIPIFSFTSHLNDYASYVFGQQYLDKQGNIFKNRALTSSPINP